MTSELTQNKLTIEKFLELNSQIDAILVPHILNSELDNIKNAIAKTNRRTLELSNIKGLLMGTYTQDMVVFMPITSETTISLDESTALFIKIRNRIKIVLMATEGVEDYSADFYATMNWFRVVRLID